MRAARFTPLIAGLALIGPQKALANEFTFGLGFLSSPDYLGADENETRAIPLIEFESERFNVRTSGLGVEAGLLNFGPISAGPILRYDGGRDPDDVDNDAVSELPEIDGTIELGGFVQAGFPLAQGPNGVTLANARLEILQGVDGGHEGLTGRVSTGIAQELGEFRVGGNLFASFGDEEYVDTFFGVPSDTTSGLTPFDAEGGIYETGVGLFGQYDFSEEVTGSVFARYSVLQGDAADSPIVADEGNEEQLSIGFGVSYTFN